MFDQKAHNRRKNSELVANGICTRCKKAKAVKGKTKCQSCADWQVQYMKKRKENQVESCICTICGKPNDRSGVHECTSCSNRRTFWRNDARYRRSIVGW